MKKIKEKNKNSNNKSKNLKSNISGALDLPKEIILDIPLITILGNEQIDIENFKGILEYSEEKVRLNTSIGILKIEGKDIYIKEMSCEKVLVIGKLHKIEFILWVGENKCY